MARPTLVVHYHWYSIYRGREIYVAFSETYKDGNGVSMEKLVIYHAPTGERIRIDIDGSWRLDPKFDRDKAEERVNAKAN